MKEISVDPSEIAHFETLSQTWWEETGPFKSLHQLNPVRLTFLRDQLLSFFSRSYDGPTPLKGLSILDVGCGGGLICEPLARLGATVTGIDATAQNIQVATAHAEKSNLKITYQHTTAEELVHQKRTFDVVVSLEVVEHVADLPGFLDSCCKLIKPKGGLCLSTLNRTPKSFLLGIVAAEYVLRWVPRGTHQWRKFVQPEELEDILTPHHMSIVNQTGVSFSPLRKSWHLSTDQSVNYMLFARKKI